MRASFVFSEVLTGLRRNVTMTVAMILTTMISLALLGGGLLVVRMIDKTQAVYEDKLEVNVYLTNDISANDKDCQEDPCKGLRTDLESNPAIETVEYENRDEAYKRFKEIFESQPELVKLARPEALPASFNVKLLDPDRPEVIIQSYSGRVGVDSIADQSEFLQRFFDALPFNLFLETATLSDDHDSSHRMKQYSIGFRHLIGPSQVNSARFVLYSLQTTRPDDRLQVLMQELQIIGGRVVEDYKINSQPLVMEILMSAYELSHRAHVGGFIDANDNNRQIAADAISPETRLGLGVERQDVRRRAQRRIGVNDARRETLKQVRLLGVDLEVTHLDLGFGPGETQLTFEDVWVVILVGECDCFFT